MATYQVRAEAVIANLRNAAQTLPTNAQINTLYTGFIYSYSGHWNQLLANLNTITSGAIANSVINPAAPNDLTDVGTLAGDPAVFTPHPAGVKLNLARLHFLREMKRHAQLIFQQEVKRATALVADDAGKTVEQKRAEVAATAVTDSVTAVGDTETEPPT